MILHDPFGRSRLVGAPTDLDGRVDALRRVVGILRSQASDDARFLADRLEAWLIEGGDLESHLGVKPRRGGRFQVPAAASRKRARDQLILDLAARSSSAGRSAQAAAVVGLLSSDERARDQLRRVGGCESLSARQVRRILARYDDAGSA